MTQVVFFGTSEFAVPIFERLAQSPWRPELVVTTPDAPSGRGLESKPPPVKVAADRLGILVIQPQKLAPNTLHLAPRDADLFIVAAYGRILPPELLKIPKCGSLNVHPSLLPRWRGASPIQHVILFGDEETGVAIILMDEKVDHGPILRFKNLNIESQKWTVPELTVRLAEIGAELLHETIPDWLAGRIEPRAQDEAQATYAPRLKKEDGRIDWSRPAQELERMVRALQPWPGAYAFWRKGGKNIRLVIESADSREGATSSSPAGTVLAIGDGFAVKTGDGTLVIRYLKTEGGKSMEAREFLRGHRDIIGSIF